MSNSPTSSDSPTSTSYLYQEYGRYFAQVAHPIEQLGGNELRDLGARSIEPDYRGVYFEADRETLYRIVYRSRLVTRVIAPLVTFDCHSDRYLYNRGRELDWVSLIGTNRTFAIFATVSNSHISHSKYAALKLKDAIVDEIRERKGKRPNVDTRSPDVWINLHIENNRATISLDAAGASLHRRGYRLDAVEAPLQETVAAAMLRMAEWNLDGSNTQPLRDPMCGSGTILAEAHSIAARIPAAYRWDSFGFQQFPDYDDALWTRLRAEEDAAIQAPPPDLVAGSDINPKAVAAARKNLARLPHGEQVRLETMDFRDLEGYENVTIVTNPPYGVRIGDPGARGTGRSSRGGSGRGGSGSSGRGENNSRRSALNYTGARDVRDLWREIGDFLKQRCTGSTAFLYAGKPKLLKSVGLRSDFKNELVNGAMEGRLARYDLY